MALVYNRYAKAFFDLSVEKNAIDVYKEELTAVTGIFLSETSFKDFLLDPKVNKHTKKQLLQNAFGAQVSINTLNFLMLLLDKNRIEYLPEIQKEFNRLSDEAKNVLNIIVLSSFPLEQDQLNRISENFKNRYHAASVSVKTELDPSLLGGIKVAVGDKLYDASIKEKLSELRSAMRLS